MRGKGNQNSKTGRRLLKDWDASESRDFPEYTPCGTLKRALDFKHQKTHHVDLICQYPGYAQGLILQLISEKTGLHDFFGTFQGLVSWHFQLSP